MMTSRVSQIRMGRAPGRNRIGGKVRRGGIQPFLLCCIALAVLGSAIPAAAAEKFRSFQLKTLDGTARTLEDYQGQATLVAFFFPSCTYCNQAFPETVKVYEKYKDQGLTMVWINIVEEEEDEIQDWLTAHQYTVPVLVGASQQYLMRRYQVQMTPEHFLLNAEGEILYKQRGFEGGNAEELEKNVIQALSLAR